MFMTQTPRLPASGHLRWLAIAVAMGNLAALPAADARDEQAMHEAGCSADIHHAFDFWVGDWVAIDPNSGIVQGVDHVRRLDGACGILQEWRQLTDRFRRAGSDSRYSGVSLTSVLPSGEWQQVWVGSDGVTVTLQGGLDPDGNGMVFEQTNHEENGATWRRRWHFVPEGPHALRSWGEVSSLSSAGWSEPRVTWQLEYVRRADVRPLRQISETSSMRQAGE